MITLIIATTNQHKVSEIRAILGDEFHCRALNEFSNPPQIEENAPTFSGNATKKAVELAQWLTQPERSQISGQAFVLADDSGLEVDALGGAPGVYSARFAAIDAGSPGNSSAADNNAKLLRLLEQVPQDKRAARFRCVLALTPVQTVHERGASPVCYADEFELSTEIFEGVCEGRIGFLPRGTGGFGYDPLFFPVGFEQTFGELPSEVKNRLSHRGMALKKLGDWFSSRLRSFREGRDK
jgi:XTP/dITP diphosphohydrolase